MKKSFLLLLLLATPLQAATYWVAKTAPNDSAACTAEGSPCLTINGALGKMAAAGGGGHTLNIKTGTYIENLNNAIPTGSAGNINTVRKFTGATVTIQPTATNAHGIVISEREYITLDGLILDGANAPATQVGYNDGIKIQSSAGTSDTGSNNITVTNCEIKNWLGIGISVATFTTNNLISNNSIHDNGDLIPPLTNQLHGIYVRGSSSTYSGNDIYGHDSGSAIQLHNENGPTGSNPLANNIITGNKFRDNRVCLIVGYSNNTLVANNLCYASQVTGGFNSQWGNPTNDKYYNNVIYTASPWQSGGNGGIYIGSGVTGAQVVNNILYGGSASEQIINNAGGSTTLTSNLCGFTQTGCAALSASPFVSAPTDFHLAATGSARGGGTNLYSTFTTDYEGTARQISGAWDVGAYRASTADSITLLSPNGGESVVKNTAYTVQWSTTGTVGALDIKYGTDGFTYPTTLVAGTANDGSQSVTMPNTASTTARVQICNAGATICDTSNANFSVTDAAGGTGADIISNNTTGSKIGTISGTSDVYITQTNPTISADTGYIYSSKWAAGQHVYGLISFDGLSQIPSTATISSVTLGLYNVGAEAGTNHTFDIRRVLRLPVEGAASWNQYSTGNNWSTGGGTNALDRVSTASAQLTGVSTTDGYVTVTSSSGAAGTLLDDVRKRVDGTYSSLWWHIERNGAGEETPPQSRHFNSSESTSTDQRPYLELTYTTTTPTITITQPVSGDHFFPGQTIPVHWQSSGVSGNVKILVSRDGGFDYEEIEDAWAVNAPDFAWTVTDGKSNSAALFKVVSVNDSNVFGISAPVKIAGKYRR